MMPIYYAKVGADGSVVIPQDLRERLRIEPGSDVEFFLTLDGEVFFHAITAKAGDWKGLIGRPKHTPSVSLRELDEALADQIVEADARTMSDGGRSYGPRRKASAAE